MEKGRLKYVYKVIISIVVCEGAGLIGSIATTPAIPTWYAALEKPSFTPPNSVFAPVWISLYLLMGIAASLVWRKGSENRPVKLALCVFLMQLILNVLWSVVFFGLESPLYGLVIIILLWIAIIVTIVKFFKISIPAGALLIPYIGWVTVAALLNGYIWMLNP